MKTRWWLLILLFVFVAGWFGGRQSTSSPENVASQGASATARTAEGLASAARESSSKRWAEKLGGVDAGKLPAAFKEIPAKNRGAALDAWLAAPDNRVLDQEKLERFRSMLDGWVAEDADAAEAWASGQGDPALRELATIGVAGSLASKDPKRAFECLVAHGEFKSGSFDSRFSSLMFQLSREALKEGPDALATLWRRLPDYTSTTGVRYGTGLDCPPGTDFRALHEAMRGVVGFEVKKPVSLSGMSEGWMMQDPEAATAYLAERIAAKEEVWESWQEMYYSRKKQAGVAVADQWVYTMLKEVPADARAKFFVDTNFLGTDGRVVELARSPEHAGWIGEALQAGAEKGNWGIEMLLQPLNDEQKVQYLKTLRGEIALQTAGQAMKNMNLPESQRMEVLAAIKGN